MNATESGMLQAALQTHSIELPQDVVRQVAHYCDLLWQANKRINLTRHTDFSTFVARDLLDVLKLSPHIGQGKELLDIGSGGGVPGILLAITRPDLEISVCESIAKKAAVLTEFVQALQLRVTVHHDRAENVLEDLRFDCCTARAVGPMWKLLTWLKDHWLHAGQLFAFKGPRWVEEVSEAKQRGLTRGLIIQPVSRYPLHSTDKDAPPVESFIIQVRRDIHAN